MSTTILNIKSKKNWTESLGFINLKDFELEEDDFISTQELLNNPQISFFCLNHLEKKAIFVETPQDIDLTLAPFYYEAQYKNALRLFAVPYQELDLLIADEHNSTIKPILIYSVGRCGSTLLLKTFNKIQDVCTISEPDVYTKLVELRYRKQLNINLLKKLLNISTRILCSTHIKENKNGICAIKMRSFDIEISDLMYQLFQQSKIIFIYRNIDDWARSAYRAYDLTNPYLLAMLKQSRSPLDYLMPSIPKYAKQNGINISSYMALQWLSPIFRYLSLYNTGVPLCAIRYEDLSSHPMPMIKTLLKYCELENNNIEDIVQIFDYDSQEGTSISRAKLRQNQKILPEDQLTEIKCIAEKLIGSNLNNFILPGTLTY